MLVGFGQKPKILETVSNSVDPKYRNYKPSPVRRVEIPKPDGGIRLLGVPTAIDRVIQQAISQILSPIYENVFVNPKVHHLSIEKYTTLSKKIIAPSATFQFL